MNYHNFTLFTPKRSWSCSSDLSAGSQVVSVDQLISDRHLSWSSACSDLRPQRFILLFIVSCHLCLGLPVFLFLAIWITMMYSINHNSIIAHCSLLLKLFLMLIWAPCWNSDPRFVLSVYAGFMFVSLFNDLWFIPLLRIIFVWELSPFDNGERKMNIICTLVGPMS